MLRLTIVLVAASACADPAESTAPPEPVVRCALGPDPLMGCWIGDGIGLALLTDYTYERTELATSAGTWAYTWYGDRWYLELTCPTCWNSWSGRLGLDENVGAYVIDDVLYWGGVFGSSVVAAGSRWSKTTSHSGVFGPCTIVSATTVLELKAGGMLVETTTSSCPPYMVGGRMGTWTPTASGFVATFQNQAPVTMYLAENMLTETRLMRFFLDGP